jgi:uncharacterized membrane protein
MSQEETYSLIIAAFDDKDSAEFVYNTLLTMENAEMVDLKMASTVYRNEKGKLKIYHKHGLTTGKGALGGVAVGVLLGGPILGGAIGALIGHKGKGELGEIKPFLDEKLGQNDSAIVVSLRDAEWMEVRNMLKRYGAEPLKLELSPQAEAALAEAAADDQVAQSVHEEIEIVDQSAN